MSGKKIKLMRMNEGKNKLDYQGAKSRKRVVRNNCWEENMDKEYKNKIDAGLTYLLEPWQCLFL